MDKKSTDDGATWETETLLSAAAGDIRGVSVDLGGTSTRFEPIWIDEGLD